MAHARKRNPRLTGEALRTWRLKHKLTTLQLAEELGISQPTWTQWESGSRFPPYYLGLALNWLAREQQQQQKVSE